MKLVYGDITIRNARREDAAILAAWWNDGSVMAHAGFPLGLGTTAETVAEGLARDSDLTRRRLMLLFREAPIGEMCYQNMGEGTANIDIKICESSYQEHGIGSVALSLLIRHLFDTGYEKITLDTNLRNTRAQHVYEKLGFVKLRVNIDSWHNQLGEPESSVDYELSRENFINFAV